MKKIKFRIAAYTDAAGKVNPDAPRNGNEDNMYVCANLGKDGNDYLFSADKEEVLNDYGCLLAVADGMGGMNAGEVASEIAINVVKESFSEDTMPEGVLQDTTSRTAFMESVIVNADAAIKTHAKSHPECEGMGSTIIMAWIYNGQATISWCGDSRTYLYRDAEGLRQISKDHSYVQGLVDAGKITADEAFDHPYGNVITRSLGDPNAKAKPDSITIPIFKGDIILVNSDGLSGVLRDRELELIIKDNRQEMCLCRQALWKAAESAGWYDNVTAILCEITEGDTFDPTIIKTASDNVSKSFLNFRIKKSTIRIISAILVTLIVGTVVWLLAHNRERHELDLIEDWGESTVDSVAIEYSSKVKETVVATPEKKNSVKENKKWKKEDAPTKTFKEQKTEPVVAAEADSVNKKSRLTPAPEVIGNQGTKSNADNPNDGESINKRQRLTPVEQPSSSKDAAIKKDTTIETVSI